MSHDVVSLELSSFRILNTEYKFVWNLTLCYYVAYIALSIEARKRRNTDQIRKISSTNM